MSERDKRGNGDRDTSGDWIRSYGPKGEYPDWHYGRTDTSHKVKATKKPADLFEADVRKIVDDLADLLLRKHKAYGPKNISQAPGGPENGLRVRMWDKMARLNHILDNPGTDTGDEALEDTLKDLANYCVIFLMVRDNRWPNA